MVVVPQGGMSGWEVSRQAEGMGLRSKAARWLLRRTALAAARTRVKWLSDFQDVLGHLLTKQKSPAQIVLDPPARSLALQASPGFGRNLRLEVFLQEVLGVFG